LEMATNNHPGKLFTSTVVKVILLRKFENRRHVTQLTISPGICFVNCTVIDRRFENKTK
jgi:hypothetical protein